MADAAIDDILPTVGYGRPWYSDFGMMFAARLRDLRPDQRQASSVHTQFSESLSTKMKRVSEVLQFPVIEKRCRPFALEPQRS